MRNAKRRQRIEHCQLLSPEDIPRFAKLGDLHAGIDDAVYSLDTLLEWADRDGLE